MIKLQSIIISLLLIWPSIMMADSNFSVSPDVLDLEGKPGDILLEKIKLTNGHSGRKLDVRVGVGDIGAASKDFPQLSSKWILIPRYIELSPGQKEVDLEVKINPYAKVGMYHSEVSLDGERLLVNIKVLDDRIENLALTKFNASKKIVYDNQVELLLEIENRGNIARKPTGRIFIYNTRGQELESISLDEYTKEIDPGVTASSTIKFVAQSDLGLGRYKVFLDLRYGKDNLASINDTDFFSVFPWRQIALIFLISVVIIVLAVHFLYNLFVKR